MMLKVFEAFAGYGSQRMALRNLGIEHEVVAISEIDKFAIASYEAIHGETNNLGDISKIDVQEIPDHDLFTYSFPCTNLSVAGKQAGFEKGSGTDSSLLWECQRVIDNKKPKYLLMENVKNLISKKFMLGFQKWIMYLESLGYSNYYEVLNAKDFGIPQNRERVFMVSILGEHEPYVFPKPIKLEKRLKDVLEDEVDEKYYLDNEKAEQLITTITDGNEIGYVPYKKGGKQHQSNTVYDKEKVAPTIEARDYKGAKQILESEPKIAASRGRGTNNEQQLEVNKDDTSNTLTTVEKDNYVVEPLGTLASGASEQFGVGYIDGLSKTLKANKHDISVLEGIPIKNDVNPEVIGGIGEKNFGSQYRQGNRVYDVNKIATALTASPVGNAGGYSSLYGDSEALKAAPTIEARDYKGAKQINKNDIKGTLYANASEDFQRGIYPLSRTLKASNHDVSVTDGYRIRKLTPLECFRLMGVTDEDFYKAQAVNSNSQLYKQAGNSIVVSVLEAIFRNMFLEVPDEDLVGEHIPLF